jgi:hypothetical protein
MDEPRIPCVLRICREPATSISGPMGTAILSRVPSFRVFRGEEAHGVFCTISRLPRHLVACGLSEPDAREAAERASQLEDPGDFIDVEVLSP